MKECVVSQLPHAEDLRQEQLATPENLYGYAKFVDSKLFQMIIYLEKDKVALYLLSMWMGVVVFAASQVVNIHTLTCHLYRTV